MRQFAIFKTNDEIVEWSKENLRRPISERTVNYHRHNPLNQAIIKKFREEFNAAVSEVEWSSKRRRLEELGKIYTKCYEKEKWSNALSALRDMREEVEGKKFGGISLTQYNYAQLTDEDLDKKRLELVELIQRHKIINTTAEVSDESREEPQNSL